MKQQKKLITILMSAVMFVSTVLQCAGTVSAADQQNGTAEAVPEMTATGSGAVGGVIAESLNKETAKIQNAEGCNIFSIETEKNKATVFFSTPQDCKLAVGVYTDLYEDGYEKMVISAVTDVKAGQESAELTFATDSMPAYYVLKAYLIGADGNLLSEEYVDQTYTKDIQTLMNSDINSYEGYEVLNLDENDDTNFVVYKKDVIVLKASEEENVIVTKDEEGGIYTIRNLSGEIKEGDSVSVEGDIGDVTVFRVQSLETDGDLTTVHADPSVKPADAFSYIKIEMTPEDFADTQESEENAAPSGKRPAQPRPLDKNEAVPDSADDDGWSGSKQLELESAIKDGEIPIPGIDASYSLANFKFSVGLKYAVRFHYYSTETHAKSAIFIQSEVDLDLTIEAKATVYCPLPRCAFNTTAFGVEFNIGFFLKLELDGYVSGHMHLSMLLDSTGVHPDVDCEFNIKAEVYAGIAIRAKCSIFGSDIEAEIGGGARAAFSPADAHPVCTFCQDIELTIEGNFEIKADISFWGIDWGFGTSGSTSLKIGDAYFSDKLGFGNGTCPNKRITGTSAASTPGTSTPGTGSDPVTTTPSEPDDGLTDEQREYLVFTGVNGGFSVSINPEHVDDIVSIVIPAEYKGRPVTEIGLGKPDSSGSRVSQDDVSYSVVWREGKPRPSSGTGFESCKNLKSIVLPETIRVIREAAFAGCTELEEINLPDDITQIENDAFICCHKMKADRLPANIREIGNRAFAGCDQAFENLIFPPSLKRMGSMVFAHCDAIRSVTASVLAIPDGTFQYCYGLKTVTLEAPTISIKHSAFFGDKNLEEVILPESLHFIGYSAFQNCNKLKKITLPEALTTLGNFALEWTAVPALEIPPNMKKINLRVLYANSAIQKIVLPKNIEYIDFSAFDYTSKLNSITVLNPDAVFAELKLTNDVVPSSYYKSQKTIYGYSGSTTEAFCQKYGFRFKALDAQPAPVVTPGTNPGTDPVVNPETEPPKNLVFKDLEPNTLYNFYDLLGEEFTSENLLFLSQGMSDKDGTLTVWYRPAQDDTDANKFVKCYETEKVEPQVYGKGLGDLNGDNSIDVSDAVLLARFCAEDQSAVITTDGLRNADVNSDGKKDGADVIRILEYIARIISSFD